MKILISYTLAATLAAGAGAHSHHRFHRLARKDAGSKVEKREPNVVTEFAFAPVETVYQLDGKLLDAQKAKAGLDGGDYVVVGESSPSYAPPPPPSSQPSPPPPAPTSASSASSNVGGQFIERPVSSAYQPPPAATTSSVPPPETSSYQPPPPPQSTDLSPSKPVKPAKPVSSGSYTGATGATGLDVEFPSGKVKCSEFPAKYGAVELDWLKRGGWSGLQYVPGFDYSALSISHIKTGTPGDTCTSGCMCSYACPPGYQKTQWPKAQGSTKQSIGGLYCNSQGYLELTRDSSKTLCEPGAGGVKIQNDLNEVVSTCRTDYPGTEAMVIPAIAQPGKQVVLTNPSQNNYYQWDGKPTSAQYYVNKKGLSVADACVWDSSVDPSGAGNWAPINIGVGKAHDGITYISIFPNAPTSNAKLDFNIEITGDVNTKCSYIDGRWPGGSNGCTTGLKPGGEATIRYF